MEYFGKAGLNGQTAKLTTVKQVREIGSAVLTCEDLSNWATDTPVFFATYKVDIDTQKIVPNSQINWRGKVNVENNTIVEIQADSDTPDKGNAIGDIVECLPTAGWANSLVDGISVIHKQDGTLKNNVVKGANIDFASFEDGSIEPGKVRTVEPTIISEIVQLGYGVNGRFNKVNKVVYFHIDATAQDYANVTMIEKIPAKFRPRNDVRFVGACINTNNFAGGFTLRFTMDGSITKSGTSGHQEYVCSGCYLTAN